MIESIYKDVFNSLPDGILLVDRNCIVIDVNNAYLEISGHKTKEEIIGTDQNTNVQRLLKREAYLKTVMRTRKPMVDINEPMPPLLDDVQGNTDNLITNRYISIFPVWDNNNEIIGSATIFKDLKMVMNHLEEYRRKASRMGNTIRTAHRAQYTFNELIGWSENFKNVKNIARKAADSELNILIFGESGTGKELFAQAIHNASPQKNQPFVIINCPSLTDSLVESELFGYEEGSFSGAVKGGKMGLCEIADGGTLFLDEIGDMNPMIQAKILRLLESGEFLRVGGTKPVKIKTRVIAATNRNITQLINSNNFRKDLYYRLCNITIDIPPLRERGGDIADLTAHFIKLFCNMFKYLTDCPAPNYPVAGFFARDPEYGIAIFSHGPKGVKRIPQYASVEQLRDNVAVPYVPSVFYTDNYIAEEAVAIAKRNGYKKIGFYNQNIIPSALSQHLKENLPGVEFTDASELLDNIKAVKSDYEIKLWTKAVEIHDHLMAAVPSILRPGRYEKEISDDIFYFARSFDCEASNIMIGSDPKKPIRNLLIFQNKRIEAGDVIQLLIEVSGPTDLWAECGRMFSLGDPCKEVLKAFDDAVVMQDWTMKQCVPGANPEAIYIEYNKSLEEMGYQPEKRIFAHGQTYDIVDRPVFWEGETMKLKKNMFVALHPVLTNKETSGYICDNFVIGEKGALRLSKTSRELFVL